MRYHINFENRENRRASPSDSETTKAMVMIKLDPSIGFSFEQLSKIVLEQTVKFSEYEIYNDHQGLIVVGFLK